MNIKLRMFFIALWVFMPLLIGIVILGLMLSSIVFCIKYLFIYAISSISFLLGNYSIGGTLLLSLLFTISFLLLSIGIGSVMNLYIKVVDSST